jgi:hypothetical protein
MNLQPKNEEDEPDRLKQAMHNVEGPAQSSIDDAIAATFGPLHPASKQDILEEAIGAVIQRGVSYDAPEDNFLRIANLWNSHLQNTFGPQAPCLAPTDVALMMSLMKIARLEFNPLHHDSYVDLAGYAACGGEIAAKLSHKKGD